MFSPFPEVCKKLSFSFTSAPVFAHRIAIVPNKSAPLRVVVWLCSFVAGQVFEPPLVPAGLSLNYRNQAMSGKNTDGGVLDDDDDEDSNDGSDSDGGDGDGGGGQGSGKDDKEYFQVPSNLSGARHFKGITKNRKTCEVEVIVKLPSRSAWVKNSHCR